MILISLILGYLFLSTYPSYLTLISESLFSDSYSFSDGAAGVCCFKKSSLLAVSCTSAPAYCPMPMQHFTGHTFT